jgi:hypothetical protein
MVNDTEAPGFAGKREFRKFVEEVAAGVEKDQGTRITNKAVLALLKPGLGQVRNNVDYSDIDPDELRLAIIPLLTEAIARKEVRFDKRRNGNYVRDIDIMSAKKHSQCHYLWFC